MKKRGMLILMRLLEIEKVKLCLNQLKVSMS